VTNFDERAATWDDDPSKLARAEAVVSAIGEVIELDGSQRVLDYGAGTGLLGQVLGDLVGPITMLDTSQGMRDVMHAKIAAGVIANARVWDLDLASAPTPDERFDLVVTVMTLHHVHDVATVLWKLAELLDEGGSLCVVDLEKEDGSFHGAGFDGHHGFDRSELTTTLTDAGFVDVNFSECHRVVRDNVTYPIFLATCRVGSRAAWILVEN
jgi:predicted TPR repeat methyltransferase